MAIICTKCKYILPKATITSYVASAAAVPMFNLAKDVTLFYLQLKIAQTKKGYVEELQELIENIAVGIAKQFQINCPICSNFEDWITEPDTIDEIAIKVIK